MADGNTGSGEGDYMMSWRKTFEKLDPNATKLIITPTVRLSNVDYGDGGGEELLQENGDTETVAIKTKATVVEEIFTEESVMEDIIIELEK